MIRSGMLIGGLALLGYWYVAQNPNNPDNPPKPPSVVVDGVELKYSSQVEKFPGAPVEAVQKLLEPLSGLFAGKQNDALEMARATQHFARNVRKNPKLATLDQFNQIRANSLEGLFQGSLPLQGNYDGKITPVSKAVVEYYLNPIMKSPDGSVVTTKLDDSSREALAQYLEAMSWKFSTEFIKEASKKEAP
jgi:hypothetical protein